MDGTREQTIVNTGLIWPNAITIDRSAQILYWADASLDKIESSNVDGTNRRTIIKDWHYSPIFNHIFQRYPILVRLDRRYHFFIEIDWIKIARIV